MLPYQSQMNQIELLDLLMIKEPFDLREQEHILVFQLKLCVLNWQKMF